MTEPVTEARAIYAPVADTPGAYRREIDDAHPPLDYPPYKSTTLRHPKQPLVFLPQVCSVSLLACSKRVPGLVASTFAAMEQEHERAAGAWQAEWGTHTELLALVGSATAWGRELLEQLEVDTGRMRANLRHLATAGVTQAQQPEEHLGGASQLINRALRAHGE